MPNGASQAERPPVVVTRPLAQSEALVRRIEASLGRRAVAFPLLEIQALADTAALRAALDAVERYAMVAFVSPNAIDAAFAVLPRWPAMVPLAVMGEGSRRALAARGIDAPAYRILAPADPDRTDSETLFKSLDLSMLRGKRVLIVRGESGRELLADSLRDAGVEVDQVAAYRRIAPAWNGSRQRSLEALLAARPDWIITSSEALRVLFDWTRRLGGETVLAALRGQRFLVPHPRIAETAEGLGLTRIVLTRSGDEALVDALHTLQFPA